MEKSFLKQMVKNVTSIFFPRVFLKIFKYIPMGEKKDPIIIYMEDFLLSLLSFGVLLASFKVVLASQTLKCMILQEACLIIEPRDVQSLNSQNIAHHQMLCLLDVRKSFLITDFCGFWSQSNFILHCSWLQTKIWA